MFAALAGHDTSQAKTRPIGNSQQSRGNKIALRAGIGLAFAVSVLLGRFAQAAVRLVLAVSCGNGPRTGTVKTLVPSFHCQLVEPFRRANGRVRTY